MADGTLAQEYSKPVRLAGAALHAAMGDEWKKATRYVQRISDECGGKGLAVAVRGWIDTYADHACDGEPDGRGARIKMINEETGEIQTVQGSGAPERIQWAARLIEARAAMDEDRYDRVLDELPDDPLLRGTFIGALLQLVARTMNGLPRGFAQMGKAPS
jgi:hypothetical protein